MTDPQLTTRSNANAVRPPAQPYSAGVPTTGAVAVPEMDDGALMATPAARQGACHECSVARSAVTLAALAARQSDHRMRTCAATLRYSAVWASRLSSGLPLHAAAQVSEAAGTDDNGCRLRAVSFSVNRPVPHMLDWYFTRSVQAGYTSRHLADGAGHVLTGSRRDGAAYVAYVRASANGSRIDLLISAAN